MAASESAGGDGVDTAVATRPQLLVVVLVGIPGSGKSTFADTLMNEGGVQAAGGASPAPGTPR